MREIDHIESIDPAEVTKEEKAAKGRFKTNQREENNRIEKEQNERKNQEINARMDRVVQKSGKPTMPRSMKKKIKKEVVEVKIDDDRVDIVRYLGEDLPGLDINASPTT